MDVDEEKDDYAQVLQDPSYIQVRLRFLGDCLVSTQAIFLFFALERSRKSPRCGPWIGRPPTGNGSHFEKRRKERGGQGQEVEGVLSVHHVPFYILPLSQHCKNSQLRFKNRYSFSNQPNFLIQTNKLFHRFIFDYLAER